MLETGRRARVRFCAYILAFAHAIQWRGEPVEKAINSYSAIVVIKYCGAGQLELSTTFNFPPS